jgi:DNA-binding NtrC family response regulator
MSSDRKTPRVFVVDDEAIIATTLGTILRLKGFDALTFDHPLEALEAARELPPDLLITDVVMPLLSGIDLAMQIRELCPNCKVLLFSGQAATINLLAEAEDRGHHFDVLTKPVHPADLLKKIETVFGD